LFDAAFCLCAAAFWFRVPFRGSIGTLILTTALFTLVVLGIGYLLSYASAVNSGASQMAVTLTMMPITLLSGYTFRSIRCRSDPSCDLLVHARYYVTILRRIPQGQHDADLATPSLHWCCTRGHH